MRFALVTLAAVVCLLNAPVMILGQSAPANPTVTVPRLIHVTGIFQPVDGQPPSGVEVVIVSIYADPDGGLPVWQERQSVTVEKSGRFALLLGASDPDGIPAAVFGAGQAQWMSLLFERAGEAEQQRVRIASVPYALKASDAETLGGLPASAYLRAPAAEHAGVVERESSSAPVPTNPDVTSAVVLPGTTNFLAKYVNGDDVGNSAVYETGGWVGIGTTTPLDLIHLRFTNPNGTLTGVAVQNLGNTAGSYSGMLFYDQNGALGQFQGFNNVTHEYRINNIARNGASQFDGSINFMLGSTSRFKIDTTLGTTIAGPVGVLAGPATIGLLVSSSGDTGISVSNTNPIGAGLSADGPLYGVLGSSDTGTAIDGFALTSGTGVFGSTDTGTAIAGFAEDPALGWAGFFDGDVNVSGTLFKGGGAFRIDHPLDPQNKYLSHSFVESPDMKNIYDGVAVFDSDGEATVTLPNWFEALNRDFRYQLTPMGAAFVPYVAAEIAGNQFKIGGGISGKKVSWQVTGIRHDAFANANRIQVEEMKQDAAVGTYLHPEAFGQQIETGRATTTAAGSKATAVKDRATERANQRKARLRAISQKPAKQ